VKPEDKVEILLKVGFTDEVIPLQLSYLKRISEKISFITDNFILFFNDLDDNEGVISAGKRLHFKKGWRCIQCFLMEINRRDGRCICSIFCFGEYPIRQLFKKPAKLL
jgi:hypothetical protein